MHELSVASAVLNTAVKHADGRRVKNVCVQTGALRQVVPESLRFYWEIVARDTECEGATLELLEGRELPGVQLTGAPWDEATLIRLSAQLEQALPWADRHPKLGSVA